jgi:hypothetical protein
MRRLQKDLLIYDTALNSKAFAPFHAQSIKVEQFRDTMRDGLQKLAFFRPVLKDPQIFDCSLKTLLA